MKKKKATGGLVFAKGCFDPEIGILVNMAPNGRSAGQHLDLTLSCPENANTIRYAAQDLEQMATTLRLQASEVEDGLPWCLYWVFDEGHAEDWFCVARSEAEAEDFYAEYEGMDYGDATAEFVTGVPEGGWPATEPGHPSPEVLVNCGLSKVPIERGGTPAERAAREITGVLDEAWQFGGRMFVAGDIVKSVAGATRSTETN